MKEYESANDELKKRRRAKLKALFDEDWAKWGVALKARGMTLNPDA